MKAEGGDGSSRIPSLLFYFVMLVSMFVAYWIHPLLWQLPATILIAYFCMRALERQTAKRRHILDDAMQRLEVQEAMAEAEEAQIDQVLEFPTICPDCKYSLLVTNVTWIDSYTLICKNCGSTIKASTTSE